MSNHNCVTINKEVEIEVEVTYDYSIDNNGIEVSIEEDSFTISMDDILSELDEDTKKEVAASLDFESLTEAIAEKFSQHNDNIRSYRTRISELITTNQSLMSEVARLKAMLSPAPEAIEALGAVPTPPKE